MTIGELRELNERYRLSEMFGIGGALVMALVSGIPLLRGIGDMRQLAIVALFLVLFALRLGLFQWNRKVEGTEEHEKAQAQMMMVSSIVLLCLHALFLAAIFYQLLSKSETPIMASSIILAITYGVYAFAKIIGLVYGMVKGWYKDLYSKIRMNLGWTMAVYTLALYTDYILTVQQAHELVWPRYVMIAAMGLVTIVLAPKMLTNAMRTLRNLNEG